MTYHRIAIPGMKDNPYYDPVISATPDVFRAQIQVLRSRFNILNLPDVLNHGTNWPGSWHGGTPAALVTFDDGYRDNYDTAFPILRELGVPATFFVASGFLERPQLPWWDHVAYTIKRTRICRFNLERWGGDPEPLRIDLGQTPSDLKRTLAVRQIIHQFLSGTIRDESWFLAQMDQQADVIVDQAAAGHSLFMGREEIRQLAANGMSVASHSHNHRALAQLAEEAQIFELAHSQHVLEHVLGCKVTAFAYPFGWRGTFSPRTQELAATAGYQFAFSSIEGINDLRENCFEPFCVRRLNVGTGDSGPLLRARIALHATLGSSFL
jgi:peptidoglycan/xylan/chitin deacetylase (PgdA/CDA1 family)